MPSHHFSSLGGRNVRPVSVPRPGRCSYHLLAELLALNEEMIVQLGVELRSATGTADFLTQMIEQHEKAAALLRAELAREDMTEARGRAAG